jgi:methylamine--corrinoid protein Co-methyltransferase
MISFWEVMGRAYNTGPHMRQKQFDLSIFKTAERLREKYGIHFNPETPITADNDLVDRVFQAGVDLFLKVGIYNISSERVIKFEREEVEETLAEIYRMPDQIFIGEASELRVLKKRTISDPEPPITIGGFIEDNPQEGQIFIQMYKSLAQEKCVDGIYYGPAPMTSQGRKYNFHTPLEIRASRQAVSYIREAIRSAGRPGLHLLDASYTALGSCINFDEGSGLRRSDALSIPTISELKVSDDLLNRVAISMEYGCQRNPFWTIIVGGFSGSVEGGVITSVASALNAAIVYQVHGSGYVMSSTILSNPPVTSDPRTYWIRNLSLQALARHTNLICGGGGSLAAGPGTEQQLWEIAGLATIIAVAGGHIMHGARKSKLVKPNQGTGLESRWMSEIAMATGHLDREEANELVNYIRGHFKESISEAAAPEGFAFEDLYEVDTCRVREEYLERYHRVKSDLEAWGLKI